MTISTSNKKYNRGLLDLVRSDEDELNCYNYIRREYFSGNNETKENIKKEFEFDYKNKG